MKKNDIIGALTKDLQITRQKASRVYDVFMESIYQSLLDDGVFRIPKVGTLSVTHREETTYRNPQTKELMKKPRHKRLKFSISNIMKESLN